MQKNKNTFLIVLIVLLLLIIAFLLGYLVRNNNSSKNDNEKNAVETIKEEVKNNTNEYSTKDETVLDELISIENDTEKILSDSEDKSVLSKAKGVFIRIVDFIFYDGTIKGVTFNELTDKGKEKVLELAKIVDEKIENKFPNYKEKISTKASDAFNKASSIIKEGASDFANFSREKIGEENYNKIIDAKEDIIEYAKSAEEIIKESGGSIVSKTKDKVKSWYEKFREN